MYIENLLLFFLFVVFLDFPLGLATNPVLITKEIPNLNLGSSNCSDTIILNIDDFFVGDSIIFETNASMSNAAMIQKTTQIYGENVVNIPYSLISISVPISINGYPSTTGVALDQIFDLHILSASPSGLLQYNATKSITFDTFSDNTVCTDVEMQLNYAYVSGINKKKMMTLVYQIDLISLKLVFKSREKNLYSFDAVNLISYNNSYMLVYAPYSANIVNYTGNGYIEIRDSLNINKLLYTINATALNLKTLDITQLRVVENEIFLLDGVSNIFYELIFTGNSINIINILNFKSQNSIRFFNIKSENLYDCKMLSLIVLDTEENLFEYKWLKYLTTPSYIRSYQQQWPKGSIFLDLQIIGKYIVILFTNTLQSLIVNSILTIKFNDGIYIQSIITPEVTLPYFSICSPYNSSLVLFSNLYQIEYAMSYSKLIFNCNSLPTTSFIKLTGSNANSQNFQTFSITYNINYEEAYIMSDFFVDYSMLNGSSIDYLGLQIFQKEIWGIYFDYIINDPYMILDYNTVLVQSQLKNIKWNTNLDNILLEFLNFLHIETNTLSFIYDDYLIYINDIQDRMFYIAGCNSTQIRDLRCKVISIMTNFVSKTIINSFLTPWGVAIIAATPQNTIKLSIYDPNGYTPSAILSLNNIYNCFLYKENIIVCSSVVKNSIDFYTVRHLEFVLLYTLSKYNIDGLNGNSSFTPSSIVLNPDKTTLLVKSGQDALVINLQNLNLNVSSIVFSVLNISGYYDIALFENTVAIIQPLANQILQYTWSEQSITYQTNFSLFEFVYTNNTQYYASSYLSNILYIITTKGVLAFKIGKLSGTSIYTIIEYESSYSQKSSVFVINSLINTDLVCFQDLHNTTFENLAQMVEVYPNPEIIFNTDQTTSNSKIEIQAQNDINPVNEIILLNIEDTGINISLNSKNTPIPYANSTGILYIKDAHIFNGNPLLYFLESSIQKDINNNVILKNGVEQIQNMSSMISNSDYDSEIVDIAIGNSLILAQTIKRIYIFTIKSDNNITLKSVFDLVIPQAPFDSPFYYCSSIALLPSEKSSISVCSYMGNNYFILTEYLIIGTFISDIYLSQTIKPSLPYFLNENYFFILDKTLPTQSELVIYYFNTTFYLLDKITKNRMLDPCNEFEITDYNVFYNSYFSTYIILAVDQFNGIRVWYWNNYFFTSSSLSTDIITIYNPNSPNDFIASNSTQAQYLDCKNVYSNLKFVNFSCLIIFKSGNHYEVEINLIPTQIHQIFILGSYLTYGNFKISSYPAINDRYFVVHVYEWNPNAERSKFGGFSNILIYERGYQQNIGQLVGIPATIFGPELFTNLYKGPVLAFFNNQTFFSTAQQFNKLLVFNIFDSIYVNFTNYNALKSKEVNLTAYTDFSYSTYVFVIEFNQATGWKLVIIFVSIIIPIELIGIILENIFIKEDLVPKPKKEIVEPVDEGLLQKKNEPQELIDIKDEEGEYEIKKID